MSTSPILLGLLLSLYLAPQPNISALGQSNQGSGGNLVEGLEAGSTPVSNKVERAKALDIKPKEVIHWTPQGAESNVETGDVLLLMQLTTDQQFTIYQKNLQWHPPTGWSVSHVDAPETAKQLDPISGKEVDVYTGGPFKVTISGPKGPIGNPIEFAVEYIGCTKVICLFPYKDHMIFPVSINPVSSSSVSSSSVSSSSVSISSVSTGSASAATTTAVSQPTISQGVSPDGPPTGNGTFEEDFAKKVKAGSMGFGMLLLIAFAGGLLTNLTPCVAPMIPITIRLLSNQGPKPLFGSSMYALGIVVTYTVLGVIAAMSGALFGNLIAHPAVSISFGVVMALLGLSMLGFGDLSKLQQLGGRIGSSKGGPFNAFLMGTGAGLVASPCTGPILAALLTYTAGRSSVAEATGLLGVYSVGFALPYVFLGAFAAKISKMRVNYRIQIATKLIFAAVMFGLSLYFLRIPLYSLFTALQPYWSMIGSVGTISGLILVAYMISKAGLEHNKTFMILPAFLLGSGLFFGIQSLTRSAAATHDSVHWFKSESEAFAESQKTGKPLLVDAWAEWCEACKKMDGTTFADKAVLDELSEHWVLFKMDLTEANDANAALQEKYDLPGLPTLTLVPSNGDLKGKFSINGYVTAPSLLNELNEFRKKSP